MSTKIFVHRVYKEHKPDPVAMAQSIAALEERARQQLRRAETRRAMSQLRCEELDERAAKLPAPSTSSIANMHCPYCWGMERAGAILAGQRKIMWRLYRGIRMDRKDLITQEYLDGVYSALFGALRKQMRFDNVTLSNDDAFKIVVTVVERTMGGVKASYEEKPYIVELPHGRLADVYPAPKFRIWTGPQLGGECGKEAIK